VNCKAFGNAVGIISGGGCIIFAYCLAYNNSVAGLVGKTAADVVFISSTVDGDAVSGHVGFDSQGGSATPRVVINNISYDNFDGFKCSRNVGELCVMRNNLVNSNSNADFVNFFNGVDNVTSAPQFEDEAGDDYSLGSGSPAVAAGYDGGSPSFADIGALQQECTGGGGGASSVLGVNGLKGGMQ
jgi:hypothetical protein